MHWVDFQGYFGPDRRQGRGKRMLERRRENCAGRPPALRTALRQLRMRVLEAHGASGIQDFMARTRAVALLATAHREPEVAQLLTSIASALGRTGDRDVREALYGQLDLVHDAIRAAD